MIASESTDCLSTVQVLVLKKLLSGKKVGNVGKAEVKMALVIFYYVVVGAMSLVTFTYIEVKGKANRDSLTELILCESMGNRDCDADLQHLDDLNVLASLSITLVAILPIVIVLFSIDTKQIKEKRKSLISRRSSTKSSTL